MKGFKATLLIALIFSLTTQVFGRVRIKDVSIKNENNVATVSIKYSGELKDNPELNITPKMVQVVIPNSIVWPKIEKNISLAGSDATLMAYQYNKELVRFRAMTPYSLAGHEGQVSMMLKENTILLKFPIKKHTKVTRAPAIKKAPAKVAKTEPKVAASSYDESYLEKLLHDKTKVVAPKKAVKKIAVKPTPVKEEIQEDKVALALSATDKTTTESKGSDMMMLALVGKFAGFLVLVLALFYAVVSLLRKGVMKKGKLGFLNNTDVVSVINTTYVGPKKSLMMVKVHKQVFLLANDEKGIHFLSEVGDLTGLIKDGEEALSGSNFDSTLGSTNIENKEFKLKEVETTKESTDSTDLSNFLSESPVKDQVKLSDQIKNKVKGLKQLQ